MPRRSFNKRVRRATLHQKSAPWSSTHLLEGNLPRPQNESSYIVTLDPETTDYFLPTWQVIRPGNPRSTGQPPPTISEYEERRHLRYHPIIRVNSLKLSFRLTWRRSFYMRVMCFAQEAGEQLKFRMFTRNRPGIDPPPPPAPNLVSIIHAPSANTRGILFSDDGPLSSNNPEHEESWFGFRPINSRHKRRVLYDSGPRKVKSNTSYSLKERVFGYTTHPRRYLGYNSNKAAEQDPVRPRTNQPPTWWIGFYHPTLATTENTPGKPPLLADHNGRNDQGADDENEGDDAPTGALIRIQRFHGDCRWTEQPF